MKDDLQHCTGFVYLQEGLASKCYGVGKFPMFSSSWQSAAVLLTRIPNMRVLLLADREKRRAKVVERLAKGKPWHSPQPAGTSLLHVGGAFFNSTHSLNIGNRVNF